jgi:FMN-dependent NADH-azoreductase
MSQRAAGARNLQDSSAWPRQCAQQLERTGPDLSMLLRIDCAPNPRALTRQLADEFVDACRRRGADWIVHRRDLGTDPVPHVSAAFVESLGTPAAAHSAAMQAAAAGARQLTEEFLAADRYLVSMPMRILTVPSQFKAYVEHVFHEEAVFRVGPDGYQGLLGGRKLLCITARGGDYRPGSPIRRFDMLEPYLRALFEFCGLAPDDIAIVSVHGTLGPDGSDRDASLAQARAQLAALASHW